MKNLVFIIGTIVIQSLPGGHGIAARAVEAYSSETLFVVPWERTDRKATGITSAGLRVRIPTQVSAEFLPPIRGPQFFDVDLEGNVYIGTNAQRPPQVRKYSRDGTLLWTIRGGDKKEPRERRIFAEIESVCCDNIGNVYINETLDWQDDRVAKYDNSGRFLGLIRTGLKHPHRLQRRQQGGFSFMAPMDNDPTGLPFAYPAVFEENRTSRDPGAWHPRDANGRTYAGSFSEEYPVGIDWRPTTATKRVMKKMGKAIVLKRNVLPKKEEFSVGAKSDAEILIPYPFVISGHHIVAPDFKGFLYMDLFLEDDSVPPDQRDRIVKVDPMKGEIVGEFLRYPAEKTIDMTHRDPVVMPETGDVYDFYDLRDGLHVVKFSTNK